MVNSIQKTGKHNRPYQSSLIDKVDLLLGVTNDSHKESLIVELPLSQLRVWSGQPRTYFGEKALQQLASSIAEQGMEYPLIVRPTSKQDEYEVIAGGRRFQAAQVAQKETAPVFIRQLNDNQALELALSENLDRENLNPIEVLNSLLDLLTNRLSLNQQQLTDLLQSMKYQWEAMENKSQDIDIPNSDDEQQQVIHEVFSRYGYNWYSYTCNQLKLRNLPDDIYRAIANGRIEYSKGLKFKSIKDEITRTQLLEQAINEGWSQRKIAEKIKDILAVTKSKKDDNQENPLSKIQGLTKRLKKGKLWKSNPKAWKKVETKIKHLETFLEELEQEIS